MARRHESRSRGELTHRGEQDAQRLSEQEGKLDRAAEDDEIVRELQKSLELGGTSEAAEGVEGAVECAEHAITEVFEREDAALESCQEETDTHAAELEERSEISASDLERVGETHGRVETREAHGDLARAESALQDDVKVLGDLLARTRDAREQSEQAQRSYEARVRGRN